MGIDIEKRDIFDLSFVTRSAKNQMRNWKIEKILILQVYYKLPLPLTTDEYSMNFSELIWSTGHLFNCSFFRYFPYYFTYIQFLTIPLSWVGSCKYNNELWISKGGVSQADNKKKEHHSIGHKLSPHNGALIKIWHMNFKVSTLL